MGDDTEWHSDSDIEAQRSGIRVDCHAGYRPEEAPQRFYIGRRPVEVTEIIDRWLDPHHSHFKVRGGDGGIYILRFDHDAGTWDLVLYNSGTLPEIRLSST